MIIHVYQEETAMHKEEVQKIVQADVLEQEPTQMTLIMDLDQYYI